jgi:phosphoribosylcarboxyaminoimidazole (NCAIR) mutase
VLEPVNAALLAAKILGLVSSAVREKVIAYQKAQTEKIVTDNQAITGSSHERV